MARKGGGGAPAWMATFADLMSLLLTLFVLMLTFSEMDVIRYKAIAGSMANALGVARKDKLSGIVEIDGSLRRTAARNVDLSKKEEEVTEVQTVSIELPSLSEEEIEAQLQKISHKKADELAKTVSSALDNEVKTGGVSVERSGGAVVIRFPSSIAFPSGSDGLNPDFKALIDRIAPILQSTPGDIIVSGHTDNVPLRGDTFESNWDLSALRATSVVHYLLFEHAINPSRITVQGYGESRPLESNDTSEGRASNRRVEVSILSPDTGKESEDAAKEADATASRGFYDE